MNWKDTVIKNITWQPPELTVKDDDKLDFTLTIPLTAMFEAQAKQSFAMGVNAGLQFYIRHQGQTITSEDLLAFFNECGLPEIAELFKHKKKARKGREKCTKQT